MVTLAVRTEPQVYRPDGAHSYFRDLIASSQPGDDDAPAAASRLRDHSAQQAGKRAVAAAQAELVLADVRARIKAETGSDIEFRVTPNTTDGTGGEFAPPTWLIDRFAGVSRAGRVLSGLVPSLPLPAGTNQINVPRKTVGESAIIQAAENSAVSDTDVTSSTLSSAVVTVAGQEDVSRQLYELSPGAADAALFIGLERAYNETLESQTINGTGLNGQLLGVRNISSVQTVSGASATTFILAWPLIGQALSKISNNRLLGAEAILMTGRRYAWMCSQVDTAGNPVQIGLTFVDVESPDQVTQGPVSPKGPIYSLPVYEDGAMTALTNADQIICVRPSDMLLFESTPRFMVTNQPNSGTLGTRLSLHRYAAFIPHRYPTGVAIIDALPAPTGFTT